MVKHDEFLLHSSCFKNRICIMKFISPLSLIVILFSCSSNIKKEANTKEEEKEVPMKTVDKAKQRSEIENELLYIVIEWKNAQKAGDFNKYASLYHKGFGGVKRVGGNKYNYNLDKWLNDRKKMFSKPMDVRVSEIKFSHNLSMGSHKVFFKQYWSSGSYSDFGSKEMHIDKTEKGYKITYEEMLDSKVLSNNSELTNVFDRDNFFERDMNILFYKHNYPTTDTSSTEKRCLDLDDAYTTCYNFTIQHAVIDSTDSSGLALVDRKVFFGDIHSNIVYPVKTKGFVTLTEEFLEDELNETYKGSIVEPTFYWNGFNEKYGILCETDKKGSLEMGQWAFISDSMPIVFEKDYVQEQPLGVNVSGNYLMFTTEFYELCVTYDVITECGDDFPQNIILWKRHANKFIEYKELSEVPAMILDLDHDGDFDILYESHFEYNPFPIEIQRSHYDIVGGDTLVSCGC